ncbi:MAG TPA: hypothetical protein VFO79_14935, partial [Xanthomonadales bacterium]|nr:hypothetical protein [Xanthomonadales bacterium]
MVAALAAQGVSEEEAHLDPVHPLLAAWGKVGRDTLRALYALPLSDEVVDAPPDRSRAAAAPEPGPTLDLFEPPPPSIEPVGPDATTLAWLKQGLDALDPGLPPPREPDASLRVHACSSRLREVEILHDALLEMFERDPALTPRDIVVMTPRLDDYAPLVEAVFGTAPEPRRIPWTVADRAARETHPLLRTFGVLLALPQSRLPASEILDLLAVEAISRRFGLHGDAGDDIARWIDALRIRWGLDADDRERVGVGRWADYGWRQGLDRLVLGYAMGGEAEAGLVATGTGAVAPYAYVEGQRAALAGALARFVERLADWRTRLAQPRSASAWQDALTALVGEFHDAQGADADEAAALATIHDAIRAVVDSARRGGQAELALPHAVVRAAVGQRLAEPERYQRFLAHGVTVCAMVPMRNVPFRVVCLLGLDDGEFPRREPEPSFHLMRARPEPGDRTRQDDDRYLFLEALLAARDCLHVSHVALNPRDGSARPPSTVVAELVDFVVAAYPPAARESVRRAVYLEHPAAPYEAASYADAASLRSYDADWVEAALATVGPRVEPPPFVDPADEAVPETTAAAAQADGSATTDGREDGPASDAVPRIALDDLLAFHRNPVRHYTRRVLELELPDLAEPADDEPQARGGLERYGIDDALLGMLGRDPAADDATLLAVLRARMLLRPGHAGARDAHDRIACVRRVVSTYRALFPGATPRTVAVDRATPRWRITGEIADVLAGGPVRLRAGGARGGDWAELAIAALLGDYESAWLVGIEQDQPFARRLDARRLDAAWLDTAVAFYLRGRTRFVPLLRYGSWVYAKDGATHPAQAAARARNRVAPANRGADQAAEIDDPAVALLLRGREDPFDEEFQVAAQALLVPLRAAIEDGGGE